MRSRRHGNTQPGSIYSIAVLVLCAAAAAACEPRTTPDDTLVMVVEAPMTTADPRFAISNLDSKLARLVYAGLMAVDTPTVEPRMDLAEAITYADPLTVDITLRADAKFSDGSPVTAADVKRTFDSVMADDSTSLLHKRFLERFVSITAVDAHHVQLRLVKPLATLMSDLDFGILSERGLGAGPYSLRELTSFHAYLDANPHYHGTRSILAHVEIKFVRDAAARLLMMVGGSADLIQNSVRVDLLDQIEDRPGVKLETAPSVILTYLMMNNADPQLADVRVRRAIAMAIDRPGIIATKFGGRARIASGMIPATHWAYNGNVPMYTRDLAAAKALLDEAGVKDPDGDGPRPRMSLTYKTSSDAFRVAIARVIAAQLADVGIAVEVRSFEFATFFADVKKGLF